jgi:hypothetical protein
MSSLSNRFLISIENESWYCGDLSYEEAFNLLQSFGSIDGYLFSFIIASVYSDYLLFSFKESSS